MQHPDISDYHLRFRLVEERHHFPYNSDLELHVLELPKFEKTESELSSGLDVWLYFLQHVETVDPASLPASLSSPLFQRAVKELLVLSQSDIERERYEARRKGQLDYISGLRAAKLEGVVEGEARGKNSLIGLVWACEQMLGRSESPIEKLQALPLEELTRLVSDLQEEAFRRQTLPGGS